MVHERLPILQVAGSGPVALAFALFALRQGWRPEQVRLGRIDGPVPPALAARQLAISLGSWQLLSRIARPPPAAPIEVVDVNVPGHPGRTRITAADMGVPALGYVLRYAPLLASLQQAARAAGLGAAAAAAAQRGGSPAQPVGPAGTGNAAAGPGANGADGADSVIDTAAPATLIVHAEGDTGEDARALEFDQAALLAEVAVEQAHGATAWECFTAEGPLALLPLPEAHRYSLVWCASPAQTRRRAALEPAALAAELQQAFGWPLGRLSIASPCTVAPLLRRSRRLTTDGLEAWIGNAAQTLHPVAGQGLNLGLRDAFQLARCLGEAAAQGQPVEAALRGYAAVRRPDRQGTIALTDTLARIFTVPPLRPLQSVALAALDVARPARSVLARRLMFGHR